MRFKFELVMLDLIDGRVQNESILTYRMCGIILKKGFFIAITFAINPFRNNKKKLAFI